MFSLEYDTKSRAHYNFWMTPIGTLCIEDLYDPEHPTKTLTNDMEDVLSEILPTLEATGDLASLERIIYRDSHLEWDAVTITRHKGLRIQAVRFYSIGVKDELLAERHALVRGYKAFE